MPQRSARSSRTPGRRFQRLKRATLARTKSVIVRAIRGGCEKKAANPPRPRTASPKKTSVPPIVTNANLGVGGMVTLNWLISYPVAGPLDLGYAALGEEVVRQALESYLTFLVGRLFSGPWGVAAAGGLD